jgi:hypothetical protein
MPKVDEAAMLKRAKKVPEPSSCGRGRAGRLVEFRTGVSFFGPNLFDADDWDGAVLEISTAPF